MRALTVAVLGLGVRSLAFATDANVVVHLYSAPDAGGAVQMCTGQRGDLVSAAELGLARARQRRRLVDPKERSGLREPAPRDLARRQSNGRLVFTEVGTNRIGIFDANGALTEYDIPTSASNPRGITSPNLVWFTEYDGNRIGRLQAGSPGSMVEFAIPTFASGPLGIAPGPGGSDDVVHREPGQQDRPHRRERRDHGVSTSRRRTAARPAIVRGFDGSQELMYFTEARGNKIASIAITGQVTERPIPTPNSSPTDLIFDDFEQAIWFTERNPGKLGWMSTDGDFREFALPGSAKPESLVIDYGQFFFGPMSIWYVDGTNRRVGRLSDNHLFAIGARHEGSLDTLFELSNPEDVAVKARLGWAYTGVCPGICPLTSINLTVPKRGEAEAAASEVPAGEGQLFYYVTGIEPEISDVPDTRAWIVDESRPNFLLEIPLVSYWTIATLQPPLPRGSNGPQPSLTFPARRRPGFRTSLVLAAIETEEGSPLELEIEALNAEGDVVASTEVEIPVADVLVLDQLLSDLDIFGDFDGQLRVTRIPRSGLFWGVVEIYESDVLTRLMPPGSELEPRGNARRGPRAATRGARRASSFEKSRDAPASRPGDGGRARRVHRLDPHHAAVPERPFLGYARKRRRRRAAGASGSDARHVS